MFSEFINKYIRRLGRAEGKNKERTEGESRPLEESENNSESEDLWKISMSSNSFE